MSASGSKFRFLIKQYLTVLDLWCMLGEDEGKWREKGRLQTRRPGRADGSTAPDYQVLYRPGPIGRSGPSRARCVLHRGALEAPSGDRIRVEFKYHDPSDALPTARLIFATNELPAFLDTSEGLWRRLLVIPFEVTIPEERQERDLAGRICRRELPGFAGEWLSTPTCEPSPRPPRIGGLAVTFLPQP